MLIASSIPGGDAAPAAPKPTAATSATPAAAGADLIGDDEFEALLDQLHGDGAPTRAAAPAPVARPAPVPAKPAAPKPAAKTGGEAEQTIRVDTKRLDAIVNLVGELVLSRNRLKTLRARIRDEELDRAVSTPRHRHRAPADAR